MTEQFVQFISCFSLSKIQRKCHRPQLTHSLTYLPSQTMTMRKGFKDTVFLLLNDSSSSSSSSRFAMNQNHRIIAIVTISIVSMLMASSIVKVACQYESNPSSSSIIYYTNQGKNSNNNSSLSTMSSSSLATTTDRTAIVGGVNNNTSTSLTTPKDKEGEKEEGMYDFSLLLRGNNLKNKGIDPSSAGGIGSADSNKTAVTSSSHNSTTASDNGDGSHNATVDVVVMKNDSIASSSSSTSTTMRTRPKFVPFPHIDLGYGPERAKCTWVARDITIQRDDLLVKSLLGPSDIANPDQIQRRAFSETSCIGGGWIDATRPTATNNQSSSHGRRSLHIFSAAQARECLKDITLLVSGDSYTRQLFIGLTDIVLNRPSNYNLWNSKVRGREHQKVIAILQNLTTKHPEFGLDIRWDCATPCFGSPWVCDKCLQKILDREKKKSKKKTIVPVIGAMVHIWASTGGNVAKTVKKIVDFFQNTPIPTVFVSQPSYDVGRTPEEYKNVTVGRHLVYEELLTILPQYESKIRFLDYFWLTNSCHFANCSTDGGHRNRFVNRWKAQLLLNTLCEV